MLTSKLPNVGTTIFTTMSQLAADTGALNLSQGFPDFDGPEALREALTRHVMAGHNQYAPMAGLPALEQARGRFLFALDEGPEKVALYRGDRRSLQGRVLFVNTDADSPAAAYMTLNDPIGQAGQIRRAVKQGFIVRTRADAETREARTGDTRRREAALTSGAQYVSTDYLWPDPRFGTGYQVPLPQGAAATCNPVRADHCGMADLEALP